MFRANIFRNSNTNILILYASADGLNNYKVLGQPDRAMSFAAQSVIKCLQREGEDQKQNTKSTHYANFRLINTLNKYRRPRDKHYVSVNGFLHVHFGAINYMLLRNDINSCVIKRRRKKRQKGSTARIQTHNRSLWMKHKVSDATSGSSVNRAKEVIYLHLWNVDN